MQGTLVAVLRGGASKEHEVSLKTGAAMLQHLAPERFHTRDIYIDKQGVWHDRGRQVEPVRALRGVDAALIALHGEYGESGEVQRMLEMLGVPYAGADSFGVSAARHKVIAKEKALELGIKTPLYRYFDGEGNLDAFIRDVIRSFHQPVVVKPPGWGSSVGISIVGGYAPVYRAAEELLASGAGGVLIEELIRGTEATAGVVEGLRGEALYSLPPIEIVPPSGDFFSYESKYNGATREICPGNFSRVATEDLMNAAKKMHHALIQRDYSRSDFIVTPRGIYFLEINSAPAVGLTPESLLPKSLSAVGISFSDFLTHLVDRARSR